MLAFSKSVSNICGFQNQTSKVKVGDNFVLVSPGFLGLKDGKISSDNLTCDHVITSFDIDADDFFPGWEDDAAAFMVPNGFGSYAWRYYIDDAESDGDYITAWANSDAVAESLEAAIGVGVWVRGGKGVESTFSFAGEVDKESSETVSRTKPIEFELVANPYPVTMNVNDFEWSLDPITSYDIDGDDFFEGWEDEAAAVMVPNGFGSYAWRYYIDDAESDGDYITAWANSDAVAEGLDIPAGYGFWVRRCQQSGKKQEWSFIVDRNF